MDEKRGLLRHTLAALAYRTTRALEHAPEAFASFDGVGRQPIQILAHMGDLFEWTLSMAQGNPAWHSSQPLAWPQEQQRFFAALARLRRVAGLVCPDSCSYRAPDAGPGG